ncbi:MAG: ATP-binding cassette domain-containing protein [Pseudomonadota bacterium]
MARRRAETVVETRGLTMRFGGVVANEDVDFRLEAGELRCLIGPNGAGKSTFFKCLTGQLTPTEGTVTIRDLDVTGAESHEIAGLGVGIKTQVPNVFDGLSVEENVRLACRRFHGAERTVGLVADTLERLRLGEIRRQRVGGLAHGQRQWVELAMVMAAEPWLVLLDEPAAGMTDEETVFTAEIIRELNRSAAMIVVEHDMNFIRAIAGRVTVFHRGRVLMEGTMDEVSADPTVRDVYLGHKH